jgi:hypothetical protein
MMTKEEKIEFENLQKSSKGLIESRQFVGLKKLLSQFYPDKNHFIYELLQNAEDAGAKRVEFKVYNDKLIFLHDGPEPFTNHHIDAITNISLSTKLDDDSKAGKFGIGFKSVYAFTDTPSIYTDRISFKIKDMFYPEELPDTKTNGKTIFEFPFNNAKFEPQQAINKIEKGLRDISPTTLLFLTNVQEIDYTLTNGKAGIITAEHIKKTNFTTDKNTFPFVEFIHCSSLFDDGKQDENSDWLRFNREINIKLGEDEKSKSRFVNIAFPIKRDNTKNGYSFIQRKGNVSIFFLAPNAKSNLYFHINAPFGCPPSRDSLSDTDDNKRLVTEIAELVHHAIMYLRDSNELTPAFFNLLPLGSDQVDSFYAPIKNEMIRIFSEEVVYPTITDGYKEKIQVISTNEQIRKIIPIKDMRFLMQEEDIFFLLNPQTRGYNFIKENKVTIVDEQTIYKFLDHLNERQINQFFEGRSKEWYKAIYAYLAEPATSKDVSLLQKCNIIFTQSKELVKPSEARFLDDSSILLDKQYKEVDHGVYSGTDKNKDKSRLFLEFLGIKPFTKNDSIAISKENYRDSLQKKLDELTEKDDIIAATKQLIKYRYSNDYEKFPLDFENQAFILNDLGELVEPNECYLDAPYLLTGLSAAKSIHNKYAISKKYKKELTKQELVEFIDLLKENDVFYCLRIEKVDIYNNPNYEELTTSPSSVWRITRYDKCDWDIINIKKYIGLKNINISKLIFNAIKGYNAASYYCAYREWQQSVRTEVPSQIVCALRDGEWLPDRNGNFRKPSQLTEETIHPWFKDIRSSYLCYYIKFGEEERIRRETEEKEAKLRSEEHKRKEAAAKELGFENQEEADEAKRKAAEFDRAQAEGRIKPAIEHIVTEPSSRVSNITRRKSKIQADVVSAAERNYAIRERSVRTNNSQPLEDAKIMLQTYYTNSDDIMFCQCCWKELPFKKRNGDYYFEVVEIDERGGKYFKKETKYPYIACCPNCAAIFKEYIINAAIAAKGIYSVVQKIKNHDTIKKENGNETIEIEMDNKQYPLTFVEKHIEDIRSVLSSE